MLVYVLSKLIEYTSYLEVDAFIIKLEMTLRYKKNKLNDLDYKK